MKVLIFGFCCSFVVIVIIWLGTHFERTGSAVFARLRRTRMLHDLAAFAGQTLGASAAIFIRCSVLTGTAVHAGFMSATVI